MHRIANLYFKHVILYLPPFFTKFAYDNETLKMRRLYYITIIFTIVLSLCGCNTSEEKFVVGVSLQRGGIRNKQLMLELEREALIYGDIELRSANAQNSSKQQMSQIEQFVREGVDLIIVIPNDADSIALSIDYAAKHSVPTVLVDRLTKSSKYTASVTTNNYDIGVAAANYIGETLGGKGSVMEIYEIGAISSNIEMSRGFNSQMVEYPNVQITTLKEGDMMSVVDSLLRGGGQYDFVFAQSDVLAHSAYLAAERLGVEKSIRFIGVGGFIGERQGLQLLSQGVLEATFRSTTTGSVVMKSAHNILTGANVRRDKSRPATMITKESAEIAMIQGKQAIMLDNRISNYKESLKSSTTHGSTLRHSVVAVTAIAIVMLILSTLYLYYRKKRAPLKFEISEEVETVESDDRYSTQEREFLTIFMAMIESNLANSEFGVESMYKQMGLSRGRFFQQVKSLTDMSPNEILRERRLKRGDELLRNSTKTVAEIAYDVGFSTPSYFSKCYKEHFGVAPNEIRA